MKKILVIMPLVFALVAVGSSELFGFDRITLHQARLQSRGVAISELADSDPTDNIRLSSTTLDFGDLQISTSASPATFEQDRSAIITLSDTAWLIAWQDERLGSSKIFGQIVDQTGSLIGANFMMAGSENGADFVEPQLLADTVGRISLFYRDQSNGLIYGRRYLADLTVDLPTYLINDTTSTSFAGPMTAAVYPDGRLVVVWENYSAVGSTIQMRLYSNAGLSLIGPVAANSDGGSAQHWVPSVAVRPSGGFLIAWEDYRNGQADIYSALFDGNGVAVGGNFGLIPSPADSADQYAPQVIYSSTHKYVIAWIDRRASQEVYAQKYDHLVGLVGSNQQVTSIDPLVNNWDVSLVVGPVGEVIASWAAYSAINRIEAVRLDNSLNQIGATVVANQLTTNQRWAPTASYLLTDELAIAWTDLADGEADINLARFTGSLVSAGSQIVLNDDLVGSVSTDPAMAGSDWYHFVAWTDQRDDAGDIYFRAMNPNGDLVSAPVRVNQDGSGNLQGEPSIAISGSTTMITWVDGRAVTGLSGQRIYARRFNEWGLDGTVEIQISDALQIAPKSEPAVALNPDGSGLIVWVDKRFGAPRLFGQWLGTDGTLIGADFAVSNGVSDIENGYLSVDVDSSGRYFVIWLDYGQSEPTARSEFFHADRSYGGGLTWTNDLSGVTLEHLASAISPNGEVALVWTGSDATDARAYLTILDSTSAQIGASTEVSDGANLAAAYPSVSIDESGYIVAGWLDGRSGRRMAYYQIYDNSQTKIGGNRLFSSATPEFMEAPTVLAHRGRAWFSWADPRVDGLNIYAGSFVYLPTDIGDPDDDLIPATYHLSQNYPNPFNPSTTIHFNLSQAGRATLTVYNLLGQEVITLADGRFIAGKHTVIWDGQNSSGKLVTSGVYFYRLTTESFSEERKMVLVK